jgi:hypothetical protein
MNIKVSKRISVLLAALFICALPALILAQETLRVGATVDYRCNCFGQEWIRAKIESVNGNSVTVRYGNMPNQVATLPVTSGDVRTLPDPVKLAKEADLRNAFLNEAGKYLQTVQFFAPAYDDNHISGGSPTTAAGWQKAVAELAELDGLCKGKYAGVTNDQVYYLRDGIVQNRYAVWCQIAADRKRIEPLARAAAAKHMITLTKTEDNLKFAFEHQKNRVPDETQQLIYDREKWRAEQVPKYRPQFTDYGVDIPVDFFVGVEKRADELKKLIEETAPNRRWEPPPFADPAVESFIKAKYAAEYPGVKVFKSGLDYKTWVERKGLSYLGSDSSYRYYKVEYNHYKRGWVLMKRSGQPFCQASEWIVGRSAKGMVVVSLGGSGIFMKCQ